MAKRTNREKVELSFSTPHVTAESVAAEIAGKQPLRRKATAASLVDRLKALPVGMGQRVTWLAGQDAALSRDRALNRVLEAIKRLRRDATIDGIKPPTFVVYEGGDRSLLVFRENAPDKDEPAAY